MLQAKTQYGKLITPALMTARQMHTIRREQFFCPVCRSPVILRAGPSVMAHFAHKTNDNCPNRDKGEGAYHEQGKLSLFNWLYRQSPQATTLETWLPDIHQRPDIYLGLAQKQVAVEYQCARIPIQHIRDRNKGYKRAHMTPIWILGANHLKRHSQYQFRMTTFLRQFIHCFPKNHPTVLLFFDPHKSEMAIVQDIYEITSVRAMGRLQISPLQDLYFTDLFKPNPFSSSELLSLWKVAKRRFRLTGHNQLHGHNLLWNQWLYEKHSHRERLPACVYLPVQFQHLMKTPIWDWQSRLCLELLLPMKIGETLTLQRSIYYLNRYLSTPSSSFHPLSFLRHPVRQYYQWLIYMGIMAEVIPDVYQKQRNITEPDHIDQALQADDCLLEELSKKLSTMKA